MNKELLIRIFSSLILIPTALFFIIKGSIFFNFFILVICFIAFYEWHNLSLNKIYYLPGFIFIFVSFYAFYFLRNEENLTFFWLILLTCISTDVGGYTFGKLLKGPKLSKISPKKTYAGVLGGFVLSIFFAKIYFSNLTFFTIAETDEEFGVQKIFIVLSLSFVSQIGDLIISLCKRKSKVKDTGRVIPGHGGILDRIDGMIFTFPYAILLINII